MEGYEGIIKKSFYLAFAFFPVIGTGGAVRIRKDSAWNVPEPELTLVISSHGKIIGYTATKNDTL